MTHDPDYSADELAMLESLGKLPSIDPKADIRARFHDRAALGYTPAHATRWRWIVAIAAVLVLAVGAGWRLDRMREERRISTLSMALIHALADLSAPTRFQAVTVAGNAGVRDSRIVAALTTSLLTDSSANVRAAAASALGRIAAPAALRNAMAESFRTERSPFVQVALLEATANLSAVDRAALLTALLATPDLDPVVRAEAVQRNRS